MNMTPVEIKRELNKIPPFRRYDIANDYLDSEIDKCSGEILRVNRLSNEKSVQLDVICREDGVFARVCFEVSLLKYPEVKIVKEGQKILIKKGKIKVIYEGPHFRLSDVEFDLIKGSMPTIGILNRGKDTIVTSNKFNTDIGIQNEGMGLVAKENEFNDKTKQPRESFLSKFFWQFVIIIISGLITAYLVFQFGWNK